MLIDILPLGDTAISIPKSAIRVVGLPTATYLMEILYIYQKCAKKNRFVEGGYCKLDRKFIRSEIGLTPEEQVVCDFNLSKITSGKKQLLTRNPNDINQIKVDEELCLALLSTENEETIKSIREGIQYQPIAEVELTKKELKIKELKDSISCLNYDLATALRDWVEGVSENPKTPLSKSAVKIFQETLLKFCGDDTEKAIDITRIATIYGYRNCDAAIDIYTKQVEKKRKIRITSQEVATKEEVKKFLVDK